MSVDSTPPKQQTGGNRIPDEENAPRSVPELQARIEAAADDETRVDLLNAFAWVIRTTDSALCLTYAQRAYNLADVSVKPERIYRRGLAEAERNLAAANNHRADYVQALKHAMNALEHFEALGDVWNQAYLLGSVMAFSMSSMGYYDAAMRYALRGLEQWRTLGQGYWIAGTLNNIGQVLMSLTQYRAARAKFEEAFTLAQQSGHARIMALVLANQAEVHYHLTEYERATSFAERSVAMYQAIAHRYDEARAWNTLGRVHMAQSAWELAQVNFEHAMDLAAKMNNNTEEIKACWLLAECTMQQGQDADAYPLLTHALEHARRIRSRQEMAEAHRLLAAYHRGQGQLEQALDHYEQYHTLESTLRGEQTQRQAQLLNIVHEVDALRHEKLSAQQRHALLYENERHLSQVLDNAADAIVMIDHQQHIIRFNQAAQRIFGYSYDEVINQPLEVLIPDAFAHVHREYVEVFRDEALTTRQMHERGHISGQRKDGSTFPARAAISKDGSGDKLVYTVFLCDLTEQKRMEAEQRSLEMEQQRVALLSRFIASTAHEFKTPLSVIRTNLYLLGRLFDDERAKARLAVIDQQAQRMDDLLVGAMTMLRIEDGTPLRRQPCNVADVLRALVDAFSEIAAEKGITLTSDPLPDKDMQCSANAEQLNMAFAKLLDNAIRYTEAGGTVMVRSTHDQYRLLIEFQDTGIGISAEHLPRIFESFYRADDSHSTPGLGLGLPVARRIVEKHGGQLTVESTPGVGSVFRVTLPLIVG